MSQQQETSARQQAPLPKAAANLSSADTQSLPAVEAIESGEPAVQLQAADVSAMPGSPFQFKTISATKTVIDHGTAFQPSVIQKKEQNSDAPMQFSPAALNEPAVAPSFPSPQAEYEGHWAPGMKLMTGAAMAGEAGVAGAKKAGEYGLAGAEKSLGLAGAGIEGSGALALEGAKASGELGLAGAKGSLALAGSGIEKSGELALAGAKASGELGLAGAKGSLALAGSGIEKSGELALAGAKASGKLGLAGAKKSLALAGSGIEASGAVAAAPARWAKERMAKTNSKLKKGAYAVAGGLGTLVSAPVGLAGAIGSGALGAAGALGSGALGATGALASGALGATGAAASGALGATGALASGALGATGAIGSGALGATGALASGALGATGAAASGALGATGAVASGALGATGAALAGTAGLAGAATSGALGLTGAAMSGTAGLAGAATAGSLGLVGMMGGGAVEGGKYVGGLAKENLNKELLGVYQPGAHHPTMGDKAAPGVPAPTAAPGEFDASGTRTNYGALSAKEGLQYGMMGGGGAATVGATITDMASKGNVVGASIAQNNFTSPLAGAADAFGGLSAGAGLLGAGAALVDARGAAKEAADSSNSGESRALSAGQAASGIADATKSTASAAYNIAGLVDAKGAAAAGAQVAAGGAAIATGAIDMVRGGYGLHTARKRAKALGEIAKKTGNKELENVAKDAIATQERAQVTAGGQIAKGAIAVTGGILLAASMATPIGWMILGAGAAVGIGVAIKNWWDKRNKKKEVVMRELGISQESMESHEKEKKAIESRTGVFTTSRKTQLAEHEKKNPLKNKLKEFGFTSVGHCYTNYMNATANKLFQSGVVNQKADYEEIITSIGLKIERKGLDPNGWKPTPEKIAKTLMG